MAFPKLAEKGDLPVAIGEIPNGYCGQWEKVRFFLRNKQLWVQCKSGMQFRFVDTIPEIKTTTLATAVLTTHQNSNARNVMMLAY